MLDATGHRLRCRGLHLARAAFQARASRCLGTLDTPAEVSPSRAAALLGPPLIAHGAGTHHGTRDKDGAGRRARVPYPSRRDPACRRCARWPNGSRRRRRAVRHRPGIRRASTPVRIARGWPAPWRLPHHGSGPCAGAALLRLSCAAAPYGRPCRRRRTGRLRGRSAALIVIKC